MRKLSRTDILFEALRSGLSQEQAEEIAHVLSPECQTVPEARVARAISQFLSDPHGKV